MSYCSFKLTDGDPSVKVGRVGKGYAHEDTPVSGKTASRSINVETVHWWTKHTVPKNVSVWKLHSIVCLKTLNNELQCATRQPDWGTLGRSVCVLNTFSLHIMWKVKLVFTRTMPTRNQHSPFSNGLFFFSVSRKWRTVTETTEEEKNQANK